MVASGCEDLIDSMLASPGVILIHGEAGAGKTTLALQILQRLCATRCLYISTERLDFLRRAEQLGLDLSRVTVFEAYDATDYLSVVVNRSLHMNDAITVDSINAYARMGEEQVTMTMLLAAALKTLSDTYAVPVIETAQVHQTERGREPLLAEALLLWADIAVTIERSASGARRVTIYNPGSREAILQAEARITERGLEWERCSTP